VQVFLERGEARFGPFHASLSGPGRADADFGQAFGLIPQLTDRFLVQAANRCPFMLDQPFEILKTAGRVPLKASGDLVQTAELRFKLADHLRVPLTGRGPLFQDAGTSFDEIDQVLFARVKRLAGDRALMERGVEAIEVRLEISQA
jgi:hypothetical protein